VTGSTAQDRGIMQISSRALGGNGMNEMRSAALHPSSLAEGHRPSSAGAQKASQTTNQSASSDSNQVGGAASTPDAATFQIHGTVLDAASGSPIARALVLGPGVAELTDTSGHFVLQGLSGSTASLSAQRPGYAGSPTGTRTSETTVTLQAEDTAVTLRLYPLSILSGRLVSGTDEPIAGANVTAYRRTYLQGYARMVPAGQARTDSRGLFRLSVPAGDYVVTTRPIGSEPETGLSVLPTRSPPLGANAFTSTLHLAAGEQKTVRLEAHTGYPQRVRLSIAAVPDSVRSVAVTAESDLGGEPDSLSARRSKDGSFDLQLPPGRYTLRTTMRGSSPQQPLLEGSASVDVLEHGENVAAISLAPQPIIPVLMDVQPDTSTASSTTLTPPATPPIQLISAAATELTSSVHTIVRQGTDLSFHLDAGRYRLIETGAGSWHVISAEYGGVDLLTQSMDLPPGAASTPLRVVVSNANLGTVTGTVTTDGSPVAAQVYIVPRGRSAIPVIRLRSNAAGSFTAANVQAGDYTALACPVACDFDPASLASSNRFAHTIATISVTAGATASAALTTVPEQELVQ
jgi:hypothetical protein